MGPLLLILGALTLIVLGYVKMKKKWKPLGWKYGERLWYSYLNHCDYSKYLNLYISVWEILLV